MHIDVQYIIKESLATVANCPHESTTWPSCLGIKRQNHAAECQATGSTHQPFPRYVPLTVNSQSPQAVRGSGAWWTTARSEVRVTSFRSTPLAAPDQWLPRESLWWKWENRACSPLSCSTPHLRANARSHINGTFAVAEVHPDHR